MSCHCNPAVFGVDQRPGLFASPSRWTCELVSGSSPCQCKALAAAVTKWPICWAVCWAKPWRLHETWEFRLSCYTAMSFIYVLKQRRRMPCDQITSHEIDRYILYTDIYVRIRQLWITSKDLMSQGTLVNSISAGKSAFIPNLVLRFYQYP